MLMCRGAAAAVPGREARRDSNTERSGHRHGAIQIVGFQRLIRLKATGTSMLPAVWPGDILTVSRRATAELQPGQIILCYRNHCFVAHRLVGQSGDSLVTRGGGYGLIARLPPGTEMVSSGVPTVAPRIIWRNLLYAIWRTGQAGSGLRASRSHFHNAQPQKVERLYFVAQPLVCATGPFDVELRPFPSNARSGRNCARKGLKSSRWRLLSYVGLIQKPLRSE